MYGINALQRQYIDDKIEKNKEFLKNLTFFNEDYKLVSMFESDLNANLSPERYFAEVNNRVHTLFAFAKELDLVPAFLTITAPSEYHYSSKSYNGSTPRETALFISSLWNKFKSLKVFKHIRDNSGHNMIYIRVYEPHKSGVPHLHAMIFLPKSYMKEVKSKFFSYFRDNHNIKQLKFITRFDNSLQYDGELGAIAYILKYMNKTFKNAKDGLMSSEAYYFAFHGIRRFITSQTLIPLWIYRKIKHDDNHRNLYDLTKDYKNGLIYHAFDKEYIIKKEVSKDIQIVDDEVLHVDHVLEEKILYQKNHFIAAQFNSFKKSYASAPKRFQIKKHFSSVPIFQENNYIGNFVNGSALLFGNDICPDRMTDVRLYDYFYNLDIETVNLQHYGYVRNTMINRGLLNEEKISLNLYREDVF